MTTALTSFESAVNDSGPSLLFRIGDAGMTVLKNTVIGAYAQLNFSPVEGGRIVPSDGIFGKPSCRFSGGNTSTGNYGVIKKTTDSCPTTAITLVLALSALRSPTPSSGAISLLSCAQAGGYSYQLETSGNIVFYINTGASYQNAGFSRNLIKSTGSLLHTTFDGRYLRHYIDGVLVASSDGGAVKSISYSSSDVYVAAESAGGVVDNNFPLCDFDLSTLGFFSRAITTSEVAAHNAAFSTVKLIAGTALLDDGSSASSLIVSELPIGRSASVVPSGSGIWSASVPAGSYLVTAIGPSGYRPISHGPVTAVDP